jgi:hypothetical protein
VCKRSLPVFARPHRRHTDLRAHTMDPHRHGFVGCYDCMQWWRRRKPQGRAATDFKCCGKRRRQSQAFAYERVAITARKDHRECPGNRRTAPRCQHCDYRHGYRRRRVGPPLARTDKRPAGLLTVSPSGCLSDQWHGRRKQRLALHLRSAASASHRRFGSHVSRCGCLSDVLARRLCSSYGLTTKLIPLSRAAAPNAPDCP